VTQMPEPKKSMAYAAVDNKIYIIGGETPDGISDRVDIYDTVTGQWSEGARKPTPVSEACGAYLDGKIIVAGGKKPDGSVTNVVEAYDVAENTWEVLPEMPHPIAGAGCVGHSGKLYVIGGWDGQKVIQDILNMNKEENKWVKVRDLYSPRVYFGLSFLLDRLLIIGGWDGHEGLDTIDYYKLTDFSIETSKESNSLLEKRYKLASVSILDRVYVIGGRGEKKNINYSVEISLEKNDSIRIITNPNNLEWESLGVCAVDKYIYGFGGQFGDKFGKDLYRIRVLYQVVLPLIDQ